MLRWEGGGSRSARGRRPDRMQWPHCLHPLTQPRPPPQLAHGRITPPSLWEPAGPAKRDTPRPQVLCLRLLEQLLLRTVRITLPAANIRTCNGACTI